MASLTETAHYTRRAITLLIVAFIGYFVLRASFNGAKAVWQKLRPPPPPPPTVAFGKLHQIEFSARENPPELSFRLETIEGGLPSLPTVGKVYFMPKKEPGFLDSERAIQKASLMGFSGQPEKVSEVFYRWQNNTEPITKLEMNINNENFYFYYPYKENPSLANQKNLPAADQAVEEAKNFLQSKGYLSADLANGPAETSYLRFVPPDLFPAVSFSEANFIRVNLFWANLDEMRILTPNPKDSLVSFLLSGSRDAKQRIVEIKFTNFPIDQENLATYPLKSAETAWQELQSGQGYIANLGNNQEGKIIIRKVSLAYYDSGEETQTFLQPIYFFEGDRDFIGYVAAIDPQWLE